MSEIELLVQFMNATKDDHRVGTAHISLYATLLSLPSIRKEHPLCVFSADVMPYCKLSSQTSYSKTLRQLHELGYVRYLPSYNHFLGSLIWVMGKK